jgi:hypothetical protein
MVQIFPKNPLYVHFFVLGQSLSTEEKKAKKTGYISGFSP